MKTRKRTMSILLAFVLVLCLLVTGSAEPGFCQNGETDDPSGLINHVQVTIPAPTGPEAIVSLEANIALQYYIEARMYLEKLSTADIDEMGPEAFKQLVDDSVTAFENADKISESLGRSVDLWMEADDTQSQPEITVLQSAGTDETASVWDVFTVTAYAAGRTPSEMTAQEIVDAFDKAKNGEKVKTLADMLGVDAKHAMAELKIAQATLEGADAAKVAEQATTCIRVAKTLKTAGTVAGLVITAAPVATGAVASMAAGEVIATGAGLVMGSVNSGLELASTGATLYYGTDENVFTQTADKIEDSDVMKTANLVVGLAGVGYNIKNQISDMNKLLDQAGNVDEYEKLLTSLSTNGGKEASNLFGIISFGLGNFDPNEGTFMGINCTPSDIDMIINIEDTKVGTSPEQIEAMKEILKDTGYSEEDADKAVQYGVELLESGGKPEGTAFDPAADLPAEFVEEKLKENEAIAPGSDYIDLDEFINDLEAFIEELASLEAQGTPEEETTASSEASAQRSQPSVTSEPENNQLPDWLNGAWSKESLYWTGWEYMTGWERYALRITILNDHTLYYEAYYYPDPEDPSKPSGVDYGYEREYTYDPETETVIIEETETGLIVGQVYDLSNALKQTSLDKNKIVRWPTKDKGDLVAARFLVDPDSYKDEDFGNKAKLFYRRD